jgi:hypothetical protein
MTNVKIQMTNQIQMIKCLNDSVKNPHQRSGLPLPSSGTAGLLAESGFPRESIKPVQLGDSSLKSFWSVSWIARGIPVFSVKLITFLDFGL